MIKANFRAYSNYVTDSLYQWDLNQVLSVSGLNLTVAPEVHFSNASMNKAIVRHATLEDLVAKVEIPNSLLQYPLTIDAHIGIYEGKTFKIIEKVSIPVIAKERPEDYRFEDTDEEIYSFNVLDHKLNDALDAFNKAKGVYDEAVALVNGSTKENKATITIKYMYANKWTTDTYSFEEDYPNGHYNIEIALNNTATAEQADAFNKAKIVGSATTNVVKAYGTIPTVNIPIIVKAVRV